MGRPVDIRWRPKPPGMNDRTVLMVSLTTPAPDGHVAELWFGPEATFPEIERAFIRWKRARQRLARARANARPGA